MLRIDVDLREHVGSDEPEQSEQSIINNKKANKPLMEKRRRARINRCLHEMKEMLVDGFQKAASPGQSKWEKADILEMSVAYMRQMQKHRIKLPHGRAGYNNKAELDDRIAAQQKSSPSIVEGFSECVREIQRFNRDVKLITSSASTVIDEYSTKLVQHLTIQLHKLAMQQMHLTKSQISPAELDHFPVQVSSNSSSKDSPTYSSSQSTSPNGVKRRRKSSSDHDDRQQVLMPLFPSTNSLSHPIPERTNLDQATASVTNTFTHFANQRVLPMNNAALQRQQYQQHLLGQFLTDANAVNVKQHLQQQISPLIWPTLATADLFMPCGANLNGIGNPWISGLWRPF
ncbi:unnamed protein product [Anisakis simplex]|uniref:Transcription cofactor HES-6 (inferred by orthology to a human protein) n=1 Tax=Anisakis simplex TaxID=6269 RepID=A0A158PPH9_ANISI|nr:unnamed protein product [Anisakis simplex]